MKINPLTAVLTQNYNVQPRNFKEKNISNPQSESEKPVPVNLDYNRYRVNFKGVSASVLETAKQIPLEDRLASVLKRLKQGDLVLIGKQLDEAKRAIIKDSSVINSIVQRVFFLEDDNIGANLGIVKNSSNGMEVLNLNPFEITMDYQEKNYTVKPHDGFYLSLGDTLYVNGNQLKIKDTPKSDLSFLLPSFVTSFNFDSDVLPEVDNLNRRTLARISTGGAKQPKKVTFEQVGGQDKLIDELKKSIIYPLRYPQGYENIEVNHGFILYGPPGTGKTHVARALANEAGANFVSLNGLDLESKWVGESEENWRKLFAGAKENQPTIIFIDEFDAVARSRNSSDEYGNKVVDQILTLMTDIDNEGDNVFVIGATNNFKALDPAITRAGRFGKHLEVGLPDLEGTRKIFDIYTESKPLSDDIVREDLVKNLHGLKASGADIRFIVNEAHSNGYERAGIFSKMENKTLQNSDLDEFRITSEDFDKAIKAFTESRSNTARKPIGYNK